MLHPVLSQCQETCFGTHRSTARLIFSDGKRVDQSFLFRFSVTFRKTRTKAVALLLWQNRPLLLQRLCLQVRSTLPGLITRSLRQATRLNERKHRLALMLKSPRWVQMCRATAIQPDSKLTQHIITESELPTGRLIQITQMNRMLKLCREVT